MPQLMPYGRAIVSGVCKHPSPLRTGCVCVCKCCDTKDLRRHATGARRKSFISRFAWTLNRRGVACTCQHWVALWACLQLPEIGMICVVLCKGQYINRPDVERCGRLYMRNEVRPRLMSEETAPGRGGSQHRSIQFVPLAQHCI